MDWRLGDLLLYTNEQLYDNFDTTKLSFNYKRLDSLLTLYEVSEMKDRQKRLSSNFIYLLFPKYYNMNVLPKIISNIDGIIAAEKNIIVGTGICDDDISLDIDNEIYKFIFSLTGSCGRHYWEVHVVDDSAEFIRAWEE